MLKNLFVKFLLFLSRFFPNVGRSQFLATAARRINFVIDNISKIPVYTDGDVKGWALDRLGNHLQLSPGIKGWYYDPTSLAPDILKYYVTFNDDGSVAYVQMFGLEGDAVLFPELVGLPKQETWAKIKYLKPITQPPPPPPPPTTEPPDDPDDPDDPGEPFVSGTLKLVAIRFTDDGILFDWEEVL